MVKLFAVLLATLGPHVLEGVGDEHRKGGGFAGDAGEQGRKYANEEHIPADRAEEDFQRLAQVSEGFYFDAVGPQYFRADDPDGQVDHDSDEHGKQQIVALDALVLRSGPTLLAHDIRVHEVGNGAGHRADHRYRHQQGAMHAFIWRNAETDGAFDDTGHVGTGHDGKGNERQGHDRQQHLHDAFDHRVDVATHQQPHRQHHRQGT